MSDSGGLRHFLDLDAVSAAALRLMLERAAAWKKDGGFDDCCAGETLILLFGKPSTRTRLSFELAMKSMGGVTAVLDYNNSQLPRGESLADTARVLSRYGDVLVARADAASLEALARHASAPVINGLTERSHPCQLMADVLTFEEKRGAIRGALAAWIGDGNNMAASWIQAAAAFGFTLRLACPAALQPPAALLEAARRRGAVIQLTEDPGEAARGADLVATDAWVSMNHNRDDGERRRRLLEPYRVDSALMALADDDALFMHCLPAHRGWEVTDEVLDGRHSAVWDEAENRLHVQKAILAWCLGKI